MFSINHRKENCHHMLLFADIEGDVGSEYNRGMYIYFFCTLTPQSILQAIQVELATREQARMASSQAGVNIMMLILEN